MSVSEKELVQVLSCVIRHNIYQVNEKMLLQQSHLMDRVQNQVHVEHYAVMVHLQNEMRGGAMRWRR